MVVETTSSSSSSPASRSSPASKRKSWKRTRYPVISASLDRNSSAFFAFAGLSDAFTTFLNFSISSSASSFFCLSNPLVKNFMSSASEYNLRRKPCKFVQSSSLRFPALIFSISSFHLVRPFLILSSCLAPWGSWTCGPFSSGSISFFSTSSGTSAFFSSSAWAGRGARPKTANARLRASLLVDCFSLLCRSSSWTSRAAFCCPYSSLFASAFSTAGFGAFSKNVGVICFSDLASIPLTKSSCLFRRCSSFSISTSCSGGSMSTSRPSATTLRTTPSGVPSPRPLMSRASVWSTSALVKCAITAFSSCSARASSRSSHQMVRATFSLGATSCSARALRTLETMLHIRSKQYSAFWSERAPPDRSSHGVIISEAGLELPRGSLCHTASVT
mmetsp:Transcript_61357/g.159293  ORF Transcript_61357/g.159293 Transcript_61357/m.159293 type:complete len:389 (-) Transcript_61357:1423-2589(-)